MIIRCPSNCECSYTFLHSYITTTKTSKDGVIEIRTFLVCNECHEWVGKPPCANPRRPCRCHDEARHEAEIVEISAMQAVDCL